MISLMRSGKGPVAKNTVSTRALQSTPSRARARKRVVSVNSTPDSLTDPPPLRDDQEITARHARIEAVNGEDIHTGDKRIEMARDVESFEDNRR